MADCLNCGTELDFDNTVVQYTEENEIVLCETGHCPNCGKKFKWKDNYKFVNHSDLEED